MSTAVIVSHASLRDFLLSPFSLDSNAAVDFFLRNNHGHEAVGMHAPMNVSVTASRDPRPQGLTVHRVLFVDVVWEPDNIRGRLLPATGIQHKPRCKIVGTHHVRNNPTSRPTMTTKYAIHKGFGASSIGSSLLNSSSESTSSAVTMTSPALLEKNRHTAGH